MRADDVLRKVEAEISGDWDRSNAHGVDLRKCVVRPPVLKEYQEVVALSQTTDKQGTVVVEWGEVPRNLWLVLEEVPGTIHGYVIVYHEQANLFGLALEGAVVGYYGNFLEALEEM
jgi:hypothetical protein